MNAPPAVRAWPTPAPGPPPAQKRLEALGNVSLGLSIACLAYSAWRVLGQFAGRGLVESQLRLLGALPHAIPVETMVSAADEFMSKIAVWEAARMVPFALASGFLVAIALRLRKGDRGALGTARAWALWAFVAVAISVVLQIMVTVPATIEYQAKLMAAVPMPPTRGAAPPFDVQKMMGSMTSFFTIAGVVGGALVFSTWPVVLLVWARKLAKETAPPA